MSIYSCQFFTVCIHSCQYLILSVHSCQYLSILLPSTQVMLLLKYYCHCDITGNQVWLALQYPWHSYITGTPTPLLFLYHLTLRRPWYSCTSDTCQCDTLTVRRLAPRRTTKFIIEAFKYKKIPHQNNTFNWACSFLVVSYFRSTKQSSPTL